MKSKNTKLLSRNCTRARLSSLLVRKTLSAVTARVLAERRRPSHKLAKDVKAMALRWDYDRLVQDSSRRREWSVILVQGLARFSKRKIGARSARASAQPRRKKCWKFTSQEVLERVS